MVKWTFSIGRIYCSVAVREDEFGFFLKSSLCRVMEMTHSASNSIIANCIQCLTLSSLPPFSDPGVSVDSDESQCEPLVYYSYSISDNPIPQWNSSSQFCTFSGE